MSLFLPKYEVRNIRGKSQYFNKTLFNIQDPERICVIVAAALYSVTLHSNVIRKEISEMSKSAVIVMQIVMKNV